MVDLSEVRARFGLDPEPRCRLCDATPTGPGGVLCPQCVDEIQADAQEQRARYHAADVRTPPGLADADETRIVRPPVSLILSRHDAAVLITVLLGYDDGDYLEETGRIMADLQEQLDPEEVEREIRGRADAEPGKMP